MRRSSLAWPGLVVGLAIGLLGVRLAVGPRLVSRTPAPGAVAASTTEIRLTFDQPMDPESVRARFHLLPEIEGTLTWDENALVFRPAVAWPAGTMVDVRLDAGARSARGLAMWSGSRWSFGLREARLAYLWPAGGAADIYARPVTGGSADRLTVTAHGVEDFALGAHATQIVYRVEGGDGGTELRAMPVEGGQDRLLFTCPEGESCTSPTLSPDGRQLAFVRGPASAPGRARLWLLDTGSGVAEVVSPEGSTALAPFWSPHGWLAYADMTRGAIVIVDTSGPGVGVPLGAVPSASGERGSWSPSGDYLVYPDLRFPRQAEAEHDAAPLLETHLIRWEVATGTLLDLSLVGGLRVDDAAPSFSPRGDWIVLARRVLTPEGWTQGRQLWRMRPDGTEAEALSDEPFINHGAPTWSPAGDMVAYLHYDLQAPRDPAEIWWLDLGQRSHAPVVVGGYLPAWIP